MTRVNLMLLLAVLASALYLVRVQYESRRLTTELDRAKGRAQELQTEHDRLDLERRALGTPLRVEKLAREQLQMRTVTPAITQYARMGDASASANAPVESIKRGSSLGNTGILVGCEPAAMMALSKVIVCGPDSFSTIRLLAEANLPTPLTTVTLRCLANLDKP